MVNVIVVDDNTESVESVTEYLEMEGIKVIGKGYNGKEGFELYQKLKPDLVILDMKMREYDGVYAITNIKKLDPNAKIIVITGYTDYEFDKNEVKAIFIKPYDLDDLLRKIKELV